MSILQAWLVSSKILCSPGLRELQSAAEDELRLRTLLPSPMGMLSVRAATTRNSGVSFCQYCRILYMAV